MKRPSTSRQRGVFTIITAIGAVLLVLILGFVVDGSRLMVIQGELQNATDACALAAARAALALPTRCCSTLRVRASIICGATGSSVATTSPTLTHPRQASIE